MSILIKGMEMPTRCEDCFCYRHNAKYNYAYCNISSVNVLGHGNARLNNCPLAPFPPHGRLIDADATLKLLRNLGSRDYRREKGTIMDAMKMLSFDEYTPTIIPAEEDE